MRNARVLLLLMVGALAGNLIAKGAAAETAAVVGQVMTVSGPVTVARSQVPPQPLKLRDALYWRDVVEARKNGTARVLLGGKTTVTVRELSRLELREARRGEGTRYAVELISGKVRASVARMLMLPGDQVEVRTWNATASVRGTDFIVETVAPPVQAGAFGLLVVRELAQGGGDRAARPGETVVVTLSGVVEVSNRLAGTGRLERVGANEAVRVSGRQDPVRVQVHPGDLKSYLKGLTLRRSPETQRGNRAETISLRDRDSAEDERERVKRSGAPELRERLARAEKVERAERAERVERVEQSDRRAGRK